MLGVRPHGGYRTLGSDSLGSDLMVGIEHWGQISLGSDLMVGIGR
jgi:hypothetical protein